MGIPGLLAALVLHEYAHAQVSTWLGDPTPGLEGRLSLNPLVHVDWLGMIMLWVFRFGWARPVQIDPRYYRSPRAGMLLVALAGPVMNVLVGIVCLALLAHVPWPPGRYATAVQTVLDYAVLYNVFFAVFNILPIPPLDGSRVLAAISTEGARLMAVIEPWGWILLIVLVLTSFIGRIVNPMEAGLLRVMATLAGARALA